MCCSTSKRRHLHTTHTGYAVHYPHTDTAAPTRVLTGLAHISSQTRTIPTARSLIQLTPHDGARRHTTAEKQRRSIHSPLPPQSRRPFIATIVDAMETRSSPSMRELRVIAHERGLKYYLHLSKPELFALLQRKQGGGAGVSSSTTTTTMSIGATTTMSTKNKPVGKRKVDGTCDKQGEAREADVVVGQKPCDGSKCSTATCVSGRVCAKGTRSSLRLSSLKRKTTNDEGVAADDQDREKKRAKTGINTLDPIMMTELGPHTVRLPLSFPLVVVCCCLSVRSSNEVVFVLF